MHRIATVACLIFTLLAALSCGDKPNVYNITIPNLKTSTDESVNTIEIRINAGTIQAISNIPIGWQFSIDNDATWISKIRGRATLPAATLASDELKRLIFNVRRNETPAFPFGVSGTLSVARAFAIRTVQLKQADFDLRGTE